MIISLLAATAIAQSIAQSLPQPYNCGYTIAPNIQVRGEMIGSECEPRGGDFPAETVTIAWMQDKSFMWSVKKTAHEVNFGLAGSFQEAASAAGVSKYFQNPETSNHWQKSLAKGQKPAPDHNYECGIIRSVSFADRDEYTVMRGQRVGAICQPIKFSFPGGEVRLSSDNWENCETESGGVITPGKGWEQCLRNANAREYTHPVHSQVVELWGFQ